MFIKQTDGVVIRIIWYEAVDRRRFQKHRKRLLLNGSPRLDHTRILLGSFPPESVRQDEPEGSQGTGDPGEHIFPHDQRVHCGARPDADIARAVIQERHFAEKLNGFQHVEDLGRLSCLVTAKDFHLTAIDHIEMGRRLALEKDEITGTVMRP